MKKDWTYKKLGEVGTVITGSTPSTKDNMNYSSQDVCFFKPSDLSSDSLVKLSKSEFYISKHAFEHSRKLPKGSVLTTCIGIIGKVGILTEEATCNQQINAIIPNPDIIISDFLGYSIMSKKHILQASANAPVVPLLNKTQFSDFSIPIPPLSIQRSIVAELDLLHSVISKKKEQLRELDNLAQSLFYQMFGDIHNKMHLVDVVPLKDVFSLITDGTHQTPIYTDDKINGFKFLSAKDVVSGVIDWSRTKYIPKELHEELHKRLSPRRNDILLCKNGTTGICALVETDEVFDIYVSLALLRPKDGILPIYLVYAINNPSTKEQFNSSLKGVGVPNLHLGEIKKAKIPLPPLSLQQSFAAKVSAIEAQKQAITQSIHHTEALLAQRMDQYFG